MSELKPMDDGRLKDQWYWKIDRESKNVLLVEYGEHGESVVMAFARYGMNGAQPLFQEQGVLVSAHDLAVPIPGQEHNAKHTATINHVAASIIANAKVNLFELDAAKARIAELEGGLVKNKTDLTWWMNKGYDDGVEIITLRTRLSTLEKAAGDAGRSLELMLARGQDLFNDGIGRNLAEFHLKKTIPLGWKHRDTLAALLAEKGSKG